jgi:arabinogalactan endo-1,4-beta-galactosidase
MHIKLAAKLAALTVIVFAFEHGLASASQNTNFLAAVDFSHLAFFESKGITYKDGGQVQDGIQILKNHGINCVRLRLFTNTNQPGGASAQFNYDHINNTAYTVPLAVRVKNAGLLFCLDFHYSDTWADPGHQLTPAAWFNLNFAQIVQQMRTYNSNTIAAFAAAGAMPDYVQIGNEITQGMLFTNSAGAIIGKVSGSFNTSWSQLGQLMKAAVQGIQDASGAHGYPVPKIIVHIDRGGDWTTTQWFFENLNYQGVPYDIIGESYYPFFQGSPANLNICLSNAAVEFGKPIVVAEDAFPFAGNFPTFWTNNNNGYGLYGYPPTPAGQASFVAAVGQIIRNVPNNLGYGFFYWGTEYQAVNGVNEAGFNTASFFDQNGNLLAVANTVGGMGAPFILAQPANLTILAGNNAAFSAAVIGATPLGYQWQQNGTNLVDGAGVSGADTTNLTLTGVTSNSATNYTLVATNAYGSVTSNVATLTVLNPTPVITGVAANPDGSFTLNFTGTRGNTYVLETTTNLSSNDGWQPIATNTFDSSGVWQFTDMQAVSSQQLFYRLKLVP